MSILSIPYTSVYCIAYTILLEQMIIVNVYKSFLGILNLVIDL